MNLFLCISTALQCDWQSDVIDVKDESDEIDKRDEIDEIDEKDGSGGIMREMREGVMQRQHCGQRNFLMATMKH